ncbi:MAG: trypsin-like peptidase domain-containing protein [Actinomycetota bacterium]|nr:trypsin-like peptidase domain-containing protein [Actinomycetota bacterium]
MLLGLGLATVLGACGGSGGGSGGGDGQTRNDTRTTTTRVEVVEPAGKGQGFDPRTIYESEAPGVVTVVSLFGSAGLDSVLGGKGDESTGIGSGFVVSGDGEIATNAHVVTQGEGSSIERSREVYVEFADGNQVKARIVGDDPNADVALLKVDPKGLRLRPLPLGSSEKVQVGTAVAAIGSPFGEKQSLSVGVVSAVDRAIDSLTEFQISGAIQTDAAINPGNSGGPLVDGAGRVIGINQQIESRSGGGEGVGFAVPVDVVKRSLERLREDGKVTYAFLRVQTVPLYPQLAEHFDLPVKEGAWVQETTAGGPGDDAGINGGGGRVRFQARSFREGGDIVTKVGGRPVRDSDDLSTAVQLFNPGQTVKVEVWRDGKRRNVDVKLGERPLTGTSAGR